MYKKIAIKKIYIKDSPRTFTISCDSSQTALIFGGARFELALESALSLSILLTSMNDYIINSNTGKVLEQKDMY